MRTARILIEVQAGMIPGHPDPEYTKKWTVTSEEWDEGRGLQTVLDRLAVANAYALKLQIDSMSGLAPNWTQTDYVWL